MTMDDIPILRGNDTGQLRQTMFAREEFSSFTTSADSLGKEGFYRDKQDLN